MSKSLYIKRQGGLYFWRIGRLGGSIYLSRRRAGPARGQSRHVIWRTERTSYGPQMIRVRSVADLGGLVLAALYSVAMSLGMTIAALAMWH